MAKINSTSLLNNLFYYFSKFKEKSIESRNLQLKVEETTQNTSSQNLNLGKILLAINNLYDMCDKNEVTKIRHEAEDTTFEKNEMGKDKKKDRNKNVNEKKGDSTKPNEMQDDVTYYRTNGLGNLYTLYLKALNYLLFFLEK